MTGVVHIARCSIGMGGMNSHHESVVIHIDTVFFTYCTGALLYYGNTMEQSI